MQWPSYFVHSSLENTDIVHLPEWYCLKYGLSLGDVIFMQASSEPGKGCLLTVGWDFLDQDIERICLEPELGERLDHLELTARSMGETLTAEKPELEKDQVPPQWILVGRPQTVPEDQDALFRKKSREQITSWLAAKNGVNFNLAYAFQNHWAFVCISQQDWGNLDQGCLEEMEFMYTSSFADWQQLSRAYAEAVDENSKLRKACTSRLNHLKEIRQETENTIRKGKEQSESLPFHHQVRTLANGLLSEIVPDFQKFRLQLRRLNSQTLRQGIDKSDYDLDQFPEMPHLSGSFTQALQQIEAECIQEHSRQQEIQEQLSDMTLTDLQEKPYLERRIDVLQENNRKFEGVLDQLQEVEINLISLQARLNEDSHQFQESIRQSRQASEDDLGRLASQLQELARSVPEGHACRIELDSLTGVVQDLRALVHDHASGLDTFRNQVQHIADRLDALQMAVQKAQTSKGHKARRW